MPFSIPEEIPVPTIEERLEARRLAELPVQQKAASLYATFDKNERTAVRIGMFPARKMQAAEAELLAEEAAAGPMSERQWDLYNARRCYVRYQGLLRRRKINDQWRRRRQGGTHEPLANGPA